MSLFIKLTETSFLEKSKQKSARFPPKIGDLNFLNAEEKTPSLRSVTPCRLSLTIFFVRSHDLTGDKEEFLAEIPQILLPARACEVPLQSRGQKNFPYPQCYIQSSCRIIKRGLSPNFLLIWF